MHIVLTTRIHGGGAGNPLVRPYISITLELIFLMLRSFDNTFLIFPASMPPYTSSAVPV